MTLLYKILALPSLGLSLAIAVPCLLQAQDVPGAVGFSPEQWDLQNARVVDHLGRQALVGTAYLKGVEFEDGVIECDVAVKSGARSYPGILFRLQSPQDYERVYLRPHRSPLYDDAVQYLASFNGVDSWQLYNGPGNTSSAVIPADRWFHVRLEVLGDQARVFLDGAPQPVLFVRNLRRGKSRGGLGLTTSADETAFFSNFIWHEDSSLCFPPAPAIHPAPGLVINWEISRPFKRRQVDFDRYPEPKLLDATRWTKVAAQPDGVLDISRSYGRLGAEPDAILARTRLRSEKAGTKKFWFGYSDEIGIFLNGQPVFYGNSAYRYRDTSFLGILGLFDSLTLPLQKGENEILCVIGEASGGWGLVFQDATALDKAPGVDELWKTGRDFLIPESAAYDPETDAFYVSNYDAYNPSQGAGKQSIVKLTADGKIAASAWVSGLFNPTGLEVRRGKLYAVERSGIVEIDIASAQIVRRIAAPGAGFLNDITVAGNGDIYVSDSRKDCIYRFSGGRAEEWLKGPEISAPNGVLAHDGRLFVGTNGEACLKAVDLATKAVSIVANLGQGLIDGIAIDSQGNILVSHNEGRMFRVTPAGRVNLILDTTSLRMNMADFCYEPRRNMVVIPTFIGGSVAAYRLDTGGRSP
jgi:sugar lactone lactonase YvrE